MSSKVMLSLYVSGDAHVAFNVGAILKTIHSALGFAGLGGFATLKALLLVIDCLGYSVRIAGGAPGSTARSPQGSCC